MKLQRLRASPELSESDSQVSATDIAHPALAPDHRGQAKPSKRRQELKARNVELQELLIYLVITVLMMPLLVVHGIPFILAGDSVGLLFTLVSFVVIWLVVRRQVKHFAKH